MAIKVKARVMGLYKGVRKREGVVFTIENESEIARWMDRLDGKPNPKAVKLVGQPAAVTPAPQAMSQINAQQKAAEDAAAKGKTADGTTI